MYYLNTIRHEITKEKVENLKMIAKNYYGKELKVIIQTLFIYSYPDYMLVEKVHLSTGLKVRRFRSVEAVLSTEELLHLLNTHHTDFNNFPKIFQIDKNYEMIPVIRKIKIHHALNHRNQPNTHQYPLHLQPSK